MAARGLSAWLRWQDGDCLSAWLRWQDGALLAKFSSWKHEPLPQPGLGGGGHPVLCHHFLEAHHLRDDDGLRPLPLPGQTAPGIWKEGLKRNPFPWMRWLNYSDGPKKLVSLMRDSLTTLHRRWRRPLACNDFCLCCLPSTPNPEAYAA